MPFAKRFDDSAADWDDKDVKNGFDPGELTDGLKKMKVDLATTPTLNIQPEEIDECLSFLRHL